MSTNRSTIRESGYARLERVIHAPAAAAWDMLLWENAGRFADSGFFSYVVFTNPEEAHAVGSIRRLVMLDGSAVTERLDYCNPEAREYSYRVIEPGPLPVHRHDGRIYVVQESSGRCRVVFEVDFETNGIEASSYQTLYRENNSLILDYLCRALSTN